MTRLLRCISRASRRTTLPSLIVLGAALSSGCAAAVGAAVAARQIGQGIAGLQQLVASSRSLRAPEVEVARTLNSPLSGTYRGVQILGEDTLRYYVRTAERPTAPILDAEGVVTGYALAGIAATTLDTLEARVSERSAGENEQPAGRALFFIEGTQPPDPSARSLFPAAFLGRVAAGEAEAADRHAAELRQLEIDLEAPDLGDLSGQGIPHELFGAVAEGIFTLTPDGEAAYEQEHTLEDGRALILRFERISATTLPAP